MQSGATMDILTIAINMEDEGAKFYRSLAEKTESRPFKAVLNMMAEDEDKHKKVFEAWQKKDPIPMDDSQVVFEANSIFKEAQKSDFIDANSQLDLYLKARDREQEAVKYYTDLKNRPENTSNAGLIDKIIREENKHLALLTDLIEFISQPEQWVESAEFGIRAHY